MKMHRRFSPAAKAGFALVAILGAMLCSSCATRVEHDPASLISAPAQPFLLAPEGAKADVKTAELGEKLPAEAPAPAEQASPPQPNVEPSTPAPPASRDMETALWEEAQGQPRRVADAAATLAEVRDELLALRRQVEATSDALRSEIERLKADQSRLQAQVEHAPRGSATASARPAAVVARSAEPTSGVIAEQPPAGKSADKPINPRSEEAAGQAAPPREPQHAPTVIVSGSVRNPGVYPVDAVRTLGGAIQAAGRRDDANVNAVEVRSENQESALLGIGLGLGAQPSKTVVDLSAIAAGKIADLPLRGGEVIFVPPGRR